MDVLHTDDAGLEWHYLCRIVCCTIEPALKVRLMISRLRRMSMPRSICWQEMLHLKCGLPAKMVVPVNWAFHAVFHSGRYSISPFRNPDASWQTNSCRFFFAMHCVEVVFSPLQGFRLVLQIRADVQECWIRCQVRIAWLYLLFIAGSQIFVIAAITVA